MDTIQSPSYDIICREINEVGYLFGIVKYVCDIVVKKVHVRYLICWGVLVIKTVDFISYMLSPVRLSVVWL